MKNMKEMRECFIVFDLCGNNVFFRKIEKNYQKQCAWKLAQFEFFH